jgi:hypothetical protein
MSASAQCLSCRFVHTAYRYRLRLREQQNMVAYLCKVVWPGVVAGRLQVLRSVLYGPPFKIRSPEELVKHACRLASSVLAATADSLIRRGMHPLTDAERQSFMSFIESRCTTETAAFDSLSSPSVVYQPASKLRIVGD